jgi:hypothetical protein
MEAEQLVRLPSDAEILSVYMQHDYVPMLSAVVDPGRPLVSRRIGMYRQGDPVPDSPGRYIGHVSDGPLVMHVFETDGSSFALM